MNEAREKSGGEVRDVFDRALAECWKREPERDGKTITEGC